MKNFVIGVFSFVLGMVCGIFLASFAEEWEKGGSDFEEDF